MSKLPKLVTVLFEQQDSVPVGHRLRAQASYRAILDFLWQANSPKSFTKNHELDLEKYVPLADHVNLLLIFKPIIGEGGAKFSYREDKKFTITVYVSHISETKFERDFDEKVKDWFVARRSSYIHEFTHYLDIKDVTDLTSIKVPDPQKEKEYFNHPNEVRAYLFQGISDIENAIEEKLLNKRKLFVREFGTDNTQFISNALKKYFNHKFVSYLTPENRELVKRELGQFYEELIPKLRESVMKITTKQLVKLIEESVRHRLSGLMEEISENPIKQDLEKELAQHDWFYNWSDDHRVWQAGNRHDQYIRDLIKGGLRTGELSRQDVEELWNKYAPAEFRKYVPQG